MCYAFLSHYSFQSLPSGRTLSDKYSPSEKTQENLNFCIQTSIEQTLFGQKKLWRLLTCGHSNKILNPAFKVRKVLECIQAHLPPHLPTTTVGRKQPGCLSPVIPQHISLKHTLSGSLNMFKCPLNSGGNYASASCRLHLIHPHILFRGHLLRYSRKIQEEPKNSEIRGKYGPTVVSK